MTALLVGKFGEKSVTYRQATPERPFRCLYDDGDDDDGDDAMMMMMVMIVMVMVVMMMMNAASVTSDTGAVGHLCQSPVVPKILF